MKKLIYFTVALLVVTFTSCTDQEEIDIKYQVNFTVLAEDVISSFKEENKGDFDIKEGELLRITTFIYKEDGTLYKKAENAIKNYHETLSFSEILPVGDYSIMSFSNVIIGSSLNDIKTECWKYSGESNISTLRYDLQIDGFVEAIAGIDQQKISIKDGKEIKETIRLKPAVSLLTLYYQNWSSTYHQFMSNNSSSYLTNFRFLYTAYKTMKYNGTNWEYSNSLNIDKYYTDNPVDVDFWIEYCEKNNISNAVDIYHYVVMIPGEFNYACNYDKIYKNGNINSYSFPNSDKMKMNLKEGIQYRINLDCRNLTFDFSAISNVDRTKVLEKKVLLSNIKIK